MKQEQKISSGVKKFIATILILGLILPSMAQAGDFIGGPSQLISTIKNSILDPITSFTSKPFAKVLFHELNRISRGEFSDANQPLAILDWKMFLNRAANQGSAKFTAELNKAFDLQNKVDKGTKLYLEAMGFLKQAQDLSSYAQYAKSTLKNDLGDSYDSFVNSGSSLIKGGYSAWYSLMKPQNNPFGQILMAEQAREDYIAKAEEAARLEGQAGQGFQNQQECIKEATKSVPDEAAESVCENEVNDCGRWCEQQGYTDPADLRACHQECGDQYHECLAGAVKEASDGVCLEYRVQNIGSEVSKMVEKTLGFDIDWLISANEIEDLFSMLMTSVLGEKTQGPGWGTTQSSQPPASWAYKPYKTMDFYQVKREPPSLEERRKARTEIVQLISSAVGRISRTVASCKPEEKIKQKGQMPENRERELTRLENQLLELLEAYVPNLYLRETGIPLKPEFQLLDPGNAPFKVFGQTWKEIFFKDYPAECAKFGKECKEFESRLPTSEDLSLEERICLDAINENLRKCKEDCGYDKNCLQECSENKATEDAIADTRCPPEAEEVQSIIPPFQPGGEGGGGGGQEEEEREGHEPYMLQAEFSVLAQTVDNATFANTAKEKYRIIQTTKNACQDCIRAAELTCENQRLTEAEKSACIRKVCDNKNLFEDIASIFPEYTLESTLPSPPERRWEPYCEKKEAPPRDLSGRGKDFYDRCEVQEKKDACYGCLKQYFMPANYAMEVRDYIGRGFIQHPFLLIETFYSRADKSIGDIIKGIVTTILNPLAGLLKLLFGGGAPKIDEYYEYHFNYCVGTCPETIFAETQCKNHSSNNPDAKVPIGLICRTFPEDPRCNSCANLTTDFLDFKPSDKDCNNQTLPGAINPLTLINNAAFRHKSKYCRALVGHLTDQYTKCSKAKGERTTTSEGCASACNEDYGMCTQGCAGSEPPMAVMAGDPICLADCLEVKSGCMALCAQDEQQTTCDQILTDCLKNCADDDEECTGNCDTLYNECIGEEICGNGICAGNETCSTCPQDCGQCSAVCGDGSCSGTETCSSCPTDCGECPYCGDGECNGTETCESCPGDCGTCF